MKLDQNPSFRHFVGLARPSEQFPRPQLRGWRRFLLFCVSLRHWDRNVSLLKCRDLIFLGGSRISFMRCPVVQMKVQRLWRFAQQNPFRARVMRGAEGVLISAMKTPFQIAAPRALLTSFT